MLLLGYFEGLDSERAIAWRAADSLSLRQFLDIALHEASPDHSTVSRTRRRIDLETHQAVFTWVLQRLADAGLVRGKTVGTMRRRWKSTPRCGASIVRRDSSEDYETFLRGLAEASGMSDADSRRAGPLRPQAPEEGVERRLDASAGPGRDDHPHEGRPSPLRRTIAACGTGRPARRTSTFFSIQSAQRLASQRPCSRLSAARFASDPKRLSSKSFGGRTRRTLALSS